MKIAICISGHLRTIKQNISTLISNVLDGNDCDLFIHTWDKVGIEKPVWWSPSGDSVNEYSYETINFIASQTKITACTIEKFIDFYDSKFDSYNQTNPCSFQGFVSMWYSKKKSFELATNYSQSTNTEYDIYFITRPDIQYEDKIVFESDDNFHVNKNLFANFVGRLSDIFFYGNKAIITNVVKIIDNLEPLLKANLDTEKLYKRHVEYLGMNLKTIECGIKQLRTSGEIIEVVTNQERLNKALKHLKAF